MLRGLDRGAVASVAGALCLALAACSPLSPPVTEAEVDAYATDLTGSLAHSSPPVEGVLDASQAVERAIAYNQSIRAARLKAAVADIKLRVDAGELLPDIVADSDYSRRSKPHLSRSSRSADYSTSTDIATLSQSIELSLNVLDFGLTLIRMQQDANRSNKEWEEVNLAALQIAEETQAAYWRAVAQQMLEPALRKLEPEVGAALALSRKAAADATLDPSDAIDFQRSLLNTRREINDLHAEIAGATYQLKTLADIPPAQALSLSADRLRHRVTLPSTTAEEDVARALRRRPEVRQHMYSLRITEQEATVAVLRILPGATLTDAIQRDSTSYLLNGHWSTLGVRATANLIELLRLPGTLSDVRAQEAYERQLALATAGAIVLQVHAARAKLAVEMQVYRDAEELATSEKELLHQVESAVAAGTMPGQSLARERLSALLAKARALIAFGDLQAAYATYRSALGDEARTGGDAQRATPEVNE